MITRDHVIVLCNLYTTVNQSIVGMVEGKRDKGQQRRKWDDDVKNWSRITRFGDIKRKAEDKLAWRDMVANLHIENGT